MFVLARGGVADPDIWWHLRDGEYLLTNIRFPRMDMYSFTVSGQPWMDHEWLAEVAYYLAWRAFGLAGVQALFMVLLELIFLGLLYLCYKTSRTFKGSVLACCISVFLATVSFGPRTILFGYIYLVVLLIVLDQFRSRGNAPLWLLPPLFCLWINTHGSWSLGLIVFAIVVASGLFQGSWRSVEALRWPPRQLRQMFLTFGSCVLALFVNPYGYRLILYPLDLAFRQKLNIAHIAEWTSVDFHQVRGKIVLILLVGLLLAALLSGHRWKLHELCLALFGLYCGLTYIRFLFLAAILLAPLLAKFLDFLGPYRPEIDKPRLNALILCGILIIMVRWFPSSSQLRKLIAKDYPEEILPYLRSHRLEGRVLNYYLWGGYLGWNDRDFKVFIDSRVDIFEYAGVLKDYIDAIELKKSLEILDKHQIRYVLFPPQEPLAYLLKQDRDWKVVFSGDVSTMFERITPLPANVTGAATSARGPG